LNDNILDESNQPLPHIVPTLMREIAGIKVGFAGLLTPKTKVLASGAKDLNFIPLAKAASAALAALKAQGAEVVVFVTHLSIAEDRELIRQVKGIDLILGGHDHKPITFYEKGVLIQKSGHDGQYLGIVNLDLIIENPTQGQRTIRIIPSWCMRAIFEIEADPKIAKMVDYYSQTLSRELNVVVGTAQRELDGRQHVVRSQESTLGDLFADGLRACYHSDVAVINGGAIRSDLRVAAGSAITLKQLHQALPFDNVAVVVELSGKQLLEALEQGFSGLPAAEGSFPQVSGMRIVYDPKGPVGARVVSVKVGDAPLDLKRSYRLATSDFLLDGGDGYTVLAKGKVIVNTQFGKLMIACIQSYLEQNPSTESYDARLTEIER
jgi:2',3'-cyclic-nucleotide 2'-phosphodiesterase (5'-nucleotidase family)